MRFVDADFEDPDGTPVVIDIDLSGEPKDGSRPYPAGPVVALRSGSGRIPGLVIRRPTMDRHQSAVSVHPDL